MSSVAETRSGRWSVSVLGGWSEGGGGEQLVVGLGYGAGFGQIRLVSLGERNTLVLLLATTADPFGGFLHVRRRVVAGDGGAGFP